MAIEDTSAHAGIWWLDGNESLKSPGVLLWENQTPKLQLFELQESAERLSPLDDGPLRARYYNQRQINVYGYANSKCISLLEARCLSASSLGDNIRLHKATIAPYSVWSGNRHLNPNTDVAALAFTCDNVQQTIGSNAVEHITPSLHFADMDQTIKNAHPIMSSEQAFFVNSQPIFSIETSFENVPVSITCRPHISTDWDSARGVSLEGKQYFSVNARQSCSISLAIEIAMQIKMFVSYCCLAKVGMSDFSALFADESNANLIWSEALKTEELAPPQHPINAPFVFSRHNELIGQALGQWLEDSEAERTARWFVYEAMGTRSYGPAKFLSALQSWELQAESVEAGDRLSRADFRQLRRLLSATIDEALPSEQATFIKARLDRLNAPALRDRLLHIFRSLDHGVGHLIIQDCDLFVRKIVDLRNMLSHIDMEAISYSNSNFTFLLRATCKLVSLSVIYQAQRLGLPMNDVEQALRNNFIGKRALEPLPA